MSNVYRRVPGMTLHNDSNGLTRYVGEANGKPHEVIFDPEGGWMLMETPTAEQDIDYRRFVLKGSVTAEPFLHIALAQLGYTATEGK